MSRDRFLQRGFVTLLLLIAILVVAGCGKKGDPIPPAKKMFALSVGLSWHCEEGVGRRLNLLPVRVKDMVMPKGSIYYFRRV